MGGAEPALKMTLAKVGSEGRSRAAGKTLGATKAADSTAAADSAAAMDDAAVDTGMTVAAVLVVDEQEVAEGGRGLDKNPDVATWRRL